MRSWAIVIGLLGVLLALAECVPARGIVLGFGKRAVAEDDALVYGPEWKRGPPRFSMGFGKRAAAPRLSLGFGKRSALYDDESSESEGGAQTWVIRNYESSNKRSPRDLKGLHRFTLGLG
ncbi:unnamed protein product, partial [Mesorhabditis spiculigera]